VLLSAAMVLTLVREDQSKTFTVSELLLLRLEHGRLVTEDDNLAAAVVVVVVVVTVVVNAGQRPSKSIQQTNFISESECTTVKLKQGTNCS
jgi:hypothetical protein